MVINDKYRNSRAIEKLVLNTLIKIMKENGVYHYLMLSLNFNPIYCSFLSSLREKRRNLLFSDDNLFIDRRVKDIKHMLSTMHDIYESNKTPKWISKYANANNSEDYKIQQMVTTDINIILHYLIESQVRDLSILEKVGKETFDFVCKKIFGDDFTDLMEPPARVVETQIGGKVLDIDNPIIKQFWEYANLNLYDSSNPYELLADYDAIESRVRWRRRRNVPQDDNAVETETIE